MEAARCADDDVCGAGARGLGGQRDAAVDGRNPQALRRGERRELLGDLGRELARRARGRAPAGRPSAPAVRSISGSPKASVLPEPVGDCGEDVEAGERVRESDRLDREGLRDGAVGEGANEPRADAERGEGGRHVGWSSFSLQGSRCKRLETPEKEDREAESHGADRQPCHQASSTWGAGSGTSRPGRDRAGRGLPALAVRRAGDLLVDPRIRLERVDAARQGDLRRQELSRLQVEMPLARSGGATACAVRWTPFAL